MRLIITDANSVARLQQELGITKILTLIEPEFPMQYLFNHKSKITRLNMVDVGTDTNLTADHYLAPSKRHVDDIIEFASQLKEDDQVIIHCFAGKSRSPAAALIVLYKLTGNFATVKEFITQMRPIATPNRMLCGLADEYFGTETLFQDFAEECWNKNS